MQKLRIGFLVSGNGGTLKFIHLALQHLNLPFTVAIVIADRACGALDYARAVKIPCQQLTYTRQDAKPLQRVLHEAGLDVVVTTIHKIIDAETLRLFPDLFINLHYSLLPAFKGVIGMRTIEQARISNTTIIGATCHEIDEQVDNGCCLAQFAVGVDWSRDASNEVYELVFRGANLILLQVLLQLALRTAPGGSSVVAMMGQHVIFTPALKFAPDQFEEEFWQRVKER